MKKLIDARGLDCPQPVIATKKVLEEGDFNRLEILVDNKAARENVSRYLKKSGYEQVNIKIEGENFRLIVESNSVKDDIDNRVETDQKEYPDQVNNVAGKTLFIGSNRMGSGSDELGEKLMTAFLYTLTEINTPPTCIIFMNSGVYLCVEGSDSLDNLIKLNNKNIEILVCGTCLNFFDLTDKLRVGKISNMYDIVEHLLGSEPVLSI